MKASFVLLVLGCTLAGLLSSCADVQYGAVPLNNQTHAVEFDFDRDGDGMPDQ